MAENGDYLDFRRKAKPLFCRVSITGINIVLHQKQKEMKEVSMSSLRKRRYGSEAVFVRL